MKSTQKFNIQYTLLLFLNKKIIYGQMIYNKEIE